MLGFSAQANAFIRHVYSFLGGAMVVLGLAGIDTDTQAKILAAVHQIGDGLSSILAGVGVLVPIAVGLWARWTAKPAQQIAAVNAIPGVAVVKDGSANLDPSVPPTVRSPWAIGLLALLLLAPLAGGCMWTDSQGNQVVLTVQNAAPLVIDKIKQVCAAYDANKVTADALADVAVQAINSETVTGATRTVREIATAACPLIESLIKTTTVAPGSG